MGATAQTGLTFEDLFDFPDDGKKRELIGGRLYVSPQPRFRHQVVIRRLAQAIGIHVDVHGGEVVAGCNVDPAVGDHVEPDVVALAAGYEGPIDELSVRAAPSLIVEVSSPSTKRYDLREKRALYERHGVPEFWFVDLDADHVKVFRLGEDGYGDPQILEPGASLETPSFPGLRISVADLLR